MSLDTDQFAAVCRLHVDACSAFFWAMGPLNKVDAPRRGGGLRRQTTCPLTITELEGNNRPGEVTSGRRGAI